MKRNINLLVLAVLMLTMIALLLFPIGKRFTLPFAAEDVSSVIVWSFWGYKETTGAEAIALIVEKMNSARLCGEFDYENYAPREGDYGYSFYFFLKDGRTYTYDTMPKPGLTSIFRDADGTYYKIKNFSPHTLWENLPLEIHSGNPFQTE